MAVQFEQWIKAEAGLAVEQRHIKFDRGRIGGQQVTRTQARTNTNGRICKTHAQVSAYLSKSLFHSVMAAHSPDSPVVIIYTPSASVESFVYINSFITMTWQHMQPHKFKHTHTAAYSSDLTWLIPCLPLHQGIPFFFFRVLLSLPSSLSEQCSPLKFITICGLYKHWKEGERSFSHNSYSMNIMQFRNDDKRSLILYFGLLFAANIKVYKSQSISYLQHECCL